MYKNLPSEFEVQALAYNRLTTEFLDYHIRGEYKFKHEDGTGSRVDIAIFKPILNAEPKLVLVLEVKKNPDGWSSKQGERYSSKLDVPCVYIRGLDSAKDVCNLVRRYLKDSS